MCVCERGRKKERDVFHASKIACLEIREHRLPSIATRYFKFFRGPPPPPHFSIVSTLFRALDYFSRRSLDTTYIYRSVNRIRIIYLYIYLRVRLMFQIYRLKEEKKKRRKVSRKELFAFATSRYNMSHDQVLYNIPGDCISVIFTLPSNLFRRRVIDVS